MHLLEFPNLARLRGATRICGIEACKEHPPTERKEVGGFFYSTPKHRCNGRYRVVLSWSVAWPGLAMRLW